MPTAMTTMEQQFLYRLPAALLHAIGAEHHFGVRPRDDLDAPVREGLLKEVAGRGIQLALHQGWAQVQHGDVHALHLEACRCFQTKQTATDHHHSCTGSRGEHLLDVVEISIGHPLQASHGPELVG